MSFSRNGCTFSGGYSSEVGRMTSCASWALFLVLNCTGSAGRESLPQRCETYSRAAVTASGERRTESVRMYVISAVWPSSPSSTPS